MIAWRGVRTFVETTVAMELAVSWKPLMYSKTSATRMTVRIRAMTSVGESSGGARGSGVLQDDVEDDVASIPAAIDALFQQLKDVLPKDYLPRIGVGARV